MRIIYGIIWIGIGFLLIKYSVALTENLGSMDWAEKYLKSGMAGTYTMYRLIGLIIIILSLLYIFGFMGSIVSPIGSLFGG